MQSLTSHPQPTCCYPIPNTNTNNLHRLRKTLINFPFSTPFPSLSKPINLSYKHQHKKRNTNQSSFTPNPVFIDEIYNFSQNPNQIGTTHNPKPANEPADEESEKRVEKSLVFWIKMWWAGLKAALGQRINIEAIACSAGVVAKDRHLAIPHVSVPDIRSIDWAELHRRGFKGVVFDKDNTITAPYSLTLWGPLASSLDQCKSVFGDDIAVFSNSSGLYEYDPDGSKARKLESVIGIKVLRHKVKKPAGSAVEIEEHFGCESSQLIMVGDRPLTDIVYGNRNGFLTILTEPLTLREEPFIVKQVRKLENFLVNRWCRRGLKPTCHNLLPDALQCVKDPSSS